MYSRLEGMMPLRTAEVNGWFKAVNECRACPYKEIKNNDSSFHICGHPDIRQTEHELTTRLQTGFIPIWCPLPIEVKYEGFKKEKISLKSDLKPLKSPHRKSDIEKIRF